VICFTGKKKKGGRTKKKDRPQKGKDPEKINQTTNGGRGKKEENGSASAPLPPSKEGAGQDKKKIINKNHQPVLFQKIDAPKFPNQGGKGSEKIHKPMLETHHPQNFREGT